MLTIHPVGRLLLLVLMVAMLVYTLSQVRKPSKWFGRLFLWIMNMSHSSLTDWGLTHVRIEERFTILDVGCGGGRTIEKLAALATKGRVYGVDYAKGSVAASSGRNAQLIKAGRVAIKQASVSQLPFPEDSFDLVSAVETHYYWPDLVKDMREILRVLKPGGTLIMIAESYRRDAKKKDLDQRQRPLMRVLRFSDLSVDDHRESFLAAGFTDVEMFEERTKGWVCGIGRKPLLSAK